jgi:hypothetical protein
MLTPSAMKTMNMEVAGPSKVLEPIYETTWGHFPEDHENLVSSHNYERILYSVCTSR